MDAKAIARMIDISAVKTESSINDINRMVHAAKHFQFVCAFSMPWYTKRLIELLSDEKDIMVGGTVGFPSGADTTSTKLAAAKEFLEMGVDEIDMVINVAALKSGFYDEVYNDVRAVVELAGKTPVKCILEIAYLADDEIRRGSEIAARAGVTFVKTGTGWGPKPTTVDTIKLIKSEIGDTAKIKAAGGVKDLKTLLEMEKAGASRFGIGINGAISIMKEVYDASGIAWDFVDKQ